MLNKTVGIEAQHEAKFMALAALATRYDVSRPYLHQLAAKDPLFPQSIKLGKRCRRWLVADVDAYFLAKQA